MLNLINFTETDFLVEEKDWLNALTKNKILSKYSLQQLQKDVAFILSACPGSGKGNAENLLTDEEQSNFMRNVLHFFADGLFDKIMNLTEVEWEYLKTRLPFDVPYSALDVPPQDW